MKDTLITGLAESWRTLHEQGLVPPPEPARIEVSPSKDPRHGDFACNLALILAAEAGLAPREVAELLLRNLPDLPAVQDVQVAGPGFINFNLYWETRAGIIDIVLGLGERYGHLAEGSGERILIEYVSANPTGPLHVGHGRGACLGSCLARILRTQGHVVESEYFINDAGRQMDVLALSVWLRYLELCGEPVRFPTQGYQGDYILDIAADCHRAQGDAWLVAFENLVAGAPDDGPDDDASNAHLDALILKARSHLADDAWTALSATATEVLLARIRRDLEEIGVHFDHWQSERELLDTDALPKTLEVLQRGEHLYEQDGALWFRASESGDEKDRVIRRSNGQWTYFVTDIAYHARKLARGYDRCINLWGSDHHGYAPRLHAAARATGAPEGWLEIILVQFVKLYRGSESVSMSTRGGQFVPLHELQQEVGTDAARFFYVLRGAGQHLDFDLALATEESAENPVYYVQYAHARICSVLARLEPAEHEQAQRPCDLAPLAEPGERALQTLLARYPEVLARCAAEREPHHLTTYLRELAHAFHSYYNSVTLLVEDDAPLLCARMRMILAVRTVLAGGLGLLGIDAPERM